MDRLYVRRWASTIRGDVVLPGDATYEDARHVWNRAIDRRPAVVVRCADNRDVVRAIELATDHDLIIAVRGGGHSQAGHSTCDGGVLIDLRRLNTVTVDSRRRVARVGAGARVGELLEALQPLGLATPTGGCPDVGVAGLTLGGGETFLSAAYGASCDNVLSAEIVTADGRILATNGGENADLFRAIRGGGGNFGVVTSLDFRLHRLTEVLFGRLTFSVRRTRDVVRAYRDLIVDVPDELQTSAGLLWSEENPAVFVALCFCGGRASGERLLDSWRARLRPERDTVKWTDYTADLVLPSVASAGTGAFLDELSDDIIDLLADSFINAPPSCTAAWNDFHGAITRVPLGATAFPLRHSGFDLFAHAGWKTAEDRAISVAWLDRIRAGLQPWTRGVYVNNLGEGEDHRVSEAYGTNYAGLALLKAKYDPNNIFRMNPNIRPAMPRGTS